MSDDPAKIDLDRETQGLLSCLERGDPRASVHLARLFVADRGGALRPFAEVLAARLSDHLSRCADIGVTDSWTALQDEVHGLMRTASKDWAEIPGLGERGQE